MLYTGIVNTVVTGVYALVRKNNKRVDRKTVAIKENFKIGSGLAQFPAGLDLPKRIVSFAG